MNGKILIAYFSWGGNTKKLAEIISSQTGGELLRIEPAVPYPENYHETAYGIAREQNENDIKPPIKTHASIGEYDTVFLGTPAWWYTMAPPVKTFLTECEFEGKVIIPFITHGGGGEYTIAKDIERLVPAARVLKSFSVYNSGDEDTSNNIANWLIELKIN